MYTSFMDMLLSLEAHSFLYRDDFVVVYFISDIELSDLFVLYLTQMIFCSIYYSLGPLG